jgi:hypothetical protein
VRERRRDEHRDVGSHRTGRRQGRLHLVQIGLRLDRDEIGAGLHEGRHLLGVGLASMLDADTAVRSESDPEGPDRAGDQHARSASESNAHSSELAGAIGHSMAIELEPVRAERIRPHDARARVDERPMNPLDGRWISEVQGLETRVERDAELDEGGAHPTVTEQGAALEEVAEFGAVHRHDSPRAE